MIKQIKIGEKKEQKRKKIILSAIEVFAQKGFHKTKISDIARLADVADGTIYLYFRNKDDLLIKSFEELILDRLNNISEKIYRIEDKVERINAFVEEHLMIYTQDPNIAKFLVIELRQSPEFYNKYPEFWPLRDYLNFLKKICQEAIDEGLIRKINAGILARSIFGIIDFLLAEWALGINELTIDQAKEAVADIIKYGIRKCNE